MQILKNDFSLLTCGDELIGVEGEIIMLREIDHQNPVENCELVYQTVGHCLAELPDINDELRPVFDHEYTTDLFGRRRIAVYVCDLKFIK